MKTQVDLSLSSVTKMKRNDVLKITEKIRELTFDNLMLYARLGLIMKLKIDDNCDKESCEYRFTRGGASWIYYTEYYNELGWVRADGTKCYCNDDIVHKDNEGCIMLQKEIDNKISIITPEDILSCLFVPLEYRPAEIFNEDEMA